MQPITRTRRTSGPAQVARPARLLAAGAAGVLLATVAPALTTTASADSDLPPGRTLVPHTVEPGDTASGLATEHRAWTKELIAHNDLGPDGMLRVGQRIEIPVVDAVAGKTRTKKSAGTRLKSAKAKSGKSKRSKRTASADDRTMVRHVVERGDTASGLAKEHRAWTKELIELNGLDPRGTLRVGQTITIPVVTSLASQGKVTSDGPTRAQVRRIIIDTAKAHGVDPHLALAISWQEAGWQMHHVSSANAIGAMQVLPSTGEWMEQYAGRELDLRDPRDNVLAGVLLLKVLDRETSSLDTMIAAYYQGIGSVRRLGIYAVSEPYVANVKALRERLRDGWNPA